MNEFEKQIAGFTGSGLHSFGIESLQVNIGLLCNQQCRHCHLEASPRRREMMEWPTMQMVLEAAGAVGCKLVDITGGAPELNPNFCRFVKALRDVGQWVQVRTNLTVLLEPGMEDMPEFFKGHNVQIVASLPCYLEENVRTQRGAGVYEKSIEALKRLNALGYGLDPGLALDLIYNPGGPFLPPDQAALEADYRRELGKRFGIVFSRLLTITNMPLGNFWKGLPGRKAQQYLQLLREAFNPQTLESLMCRRQLSVGWNGKLYDCDFNLALGYPVNHGASEYLERLEPSAHARRQIVTGNHCFGCTAGSGSSCGGALLKNGHTQ